jgi:hypothetical protein
MKKINRRKSDIALDIIYWTAAAIVFAMLVTTIYMMLNI